MINYFLRGRKNYIQNTLRLLILAVILLNSACKPDNVKEGSTNKYFDIKGYFANSVKQLSQGPVKIISKTVTHNGTSESKEVQIKNWASELALFSESDINKPAWRESYKISAKPNQIIYTAKDPELRTRSIVISKTATGKVLNITIDNQVNNALYKTSERLTFLPDSLYSIEKHQKILLLGANNYKISGKLINGGR